jgi:hypothetical protein
MKSIKSKDRRITGDMEEALVKALAETESRDCLAVQVY